MKLIIIVGILAGSLCAAISIRMYLYPREPRVDVDIYSDIDVNKETGAIRKYKWSAVSVSADGKFDCVDTFSELRGEDVEREANSLAHKLRSKIGVLKQ